MSEPHGPGPVLAKGRAPMTQRALPNPRSSVGGRTLGGQALGGQALGLVLAIVLALAGCDGNLLDGPIGPIGAPTDPSCTGEQCREAPAPASRFPRLSHPQYENSVRDLLRLDAAPGITGTYLGDATSTTFDNNGSELRVGDALWGDYQRGAESLAGQVTTDPEALARIAEGASTGPAFVEAFGLRAHRRPLTTEERTAYEALFVAGDAAYPEMGDAFAAGVRLVLEAMLQSPAFLYRAELSSERAEGVIALTDYELAARLSYALWDTMPDDELLRAAQAGELTEGDGMRVQAERMLMDAKAEDMVASFHRQLLAMDHYLDVSRSTTLFPEFTPDLRQSMVDETQAFVRHVVFEEDEGLSRLLTAPYTFVDADLARVYGLEGTYGDTVEQVDLDPTQRAGLLTQIGFLATNASSTDPDAIHRGVFVNHRILCAPLPPPPMVVPPLPPDETGARTMRERIDAHTGPGTCGASCHGTMINPIGFAFEHYDALGRWRDEDHGSPVDAAAEYEFAGGPVAYADAVDLAGVLADESATHRCYTRQWIEYAYGRKVASTDAQLITRVASGSLSGDLSVREILLELVTSEAFRTRATTELE